MASLCAPCGAFGYTRMKSSSEARVPILQKFCSIRKTFSKGLVKLLRRTQKQNCLRHTIPSLEYVHHPRVLPSAQYDGTRHMDTSDTWRLFIEVRIMRDKNWFGANAMMRSFSGFSIIICKSLTAGKRKQA